MSTQDRQAYLQTARERLANGIQAIDQVSNTHLPTDAVRAGAALAAANFQAAELALHLMEASA